MISRRIIFILILSFVSIYTSKAFADGENALQRKKRKVFLSIALESRMSFWKISKDEHGLTAPFDGSDKIEEANSDPGILLGSELELLYLNFFIRGSYLQGRFGFNIGDVKRDDIGTDIGIEQVQGSLRAGIFVGWRKMMVSYSDWRSENIEEDNISDVVLGFIIRTTPDKVGFRVNIEGAFGLKLFFGKGAMEDIIVADVPVDFGYRFNALPLGINVGYGIWYYYLPTSEVDEHYNRIWGKTFRYIEGQGNLTHGPILKIGYSF